MPSGWTRWLLRAVRVPVRGRLSAELDAGNLASKFDVLVFVDGGIPERDGASAVGVIGGVLAAEATGPPAESIPEEYPRRLGESRSPRRSRNSKSSSKKVAAVITIGSSTMLAHHFGLPVGEHLVEKTADGPIGRCRATVLRARLGAAASPSTTHIRWRTACRLTSMCSSTTARRWRLDPAGDAQGRPPVAWFDRPHRCGAVGRGVSSISKAPWRWLKRRSERGASSCWRRR